MRALLGVFSLLVIGSTAFAVNELRELRHHAAAPVAAPEPPAVAQPPEAMPVAAVQPATPPPLSTWRGPTPFGGVPAAADDEADVDDDGEGVPDVEDRCPDEND